MICARLHVKLHVPNKVCLLAWLHVASLHMASLHAMKRPQATKSCSPQPCTCPALILDALTCNPPRLWHVTAPLPSHLLLSFSHKFTTKFRLPRTSRAES